MITSLLWLSVPLLFWILSHLTSLNLFVDRYFIPKEAAVVLVLAWFFNHIIKRFPKVKSYNLIRISTSIICVFTILVYTKRASFALNKNTNYHHSLIIKKSYPYSEQPIIIEGDPKYFPNAYLGKNEYIFTYEPACILDIYKRFSAKIKFLDQ